MTVTLCVRVPPNPVQAREKLAAAVIGPVSSEPEVAFSPDQSPEATHSVALVLDQLRVVVAPDDTAEGVADKVTVGAAGALGASVRESVSPPPPPPQPATEASANTSVSLG